MIMIIEFSFFICALWVICMPCFTTDYEKMLKNAESAKIIAYHQTLKLNISRSRGRNITNHTIFIQRT